MKALEGSMAAWKGGRFRKSLQMEIAVMLTLVSAVCIFALGLLFSRQFADSANRSLMDKNEQLLMQMADQMTYHTESMLAAFDQLYDGMLCHYEEIGRAEEETLDFYLKGVPLESVGMFDMDGSCTFSYPFRPADGRAPVDAAWFRNAVEADGRTYFMPPHDDRVYPQEADGRGKVISLSRYVSVRRGGNVERQVMLLNFSAEHMFRILRHEQDVYSYYYLVDADGELLFHPKERLIEDGTFREDTVSRVRKEDGSYQVRVEAGRMNISVKTLYYTGWRIVYVTDVSAYLAKERPMQLYVNWFIMAMLVGLLVFVNIFVARKITLPVRQLEKAADEFSAGNFDKIETIQGAHEIMHLGEKFSEMAANIERLMADTQEQQEERRKTEIRLLQSQINPHFLYNTLDSIIWMLQSGKYDGAGEMLSALADFYRGTLNNGEDMITIEKELSRINGYLLIQHMRFADVFVYEIHAEESLLQCECPNMIVQPLVENAVYHGVENSLGDGKIVIRVYGRGDDILIEVGDNGAGMSEERVREIMSGNVVSGRSGSGVGLRNIDQRIRMIYGGDYGITIQSEEDEGTLVGIRIPRRDVF